MAALKLTPRPAKQLGNLSILRVRPGSSLHVASFSFISPLKKPAVINKRLVVANVHNLTRRNANKIFNVNVVFPRGTSNRSYRQTAITLAA